MQGMSQAEISEKIIADAMSDIRTTEGQLDTVIREMKEAMPQYQKYLNLFQDRENKNKQLAALSEKLSEFTLLARTQKPPVRIVDPADEPTAPIKPNKPVYIAVCIILGMAMGLAMVCLLEHLDHSVKVPEHLTAGLALPLFGVVPRIRRLARNHRGGISGPPGSPTRSRPMPTGTSGPASWVRPGTRSRSSPCWSPAPRRGRARARPR